jgi:hypothetical protein
MLLDRQSGALVIVPVSVSRSSKRFTSPSTNPSTISAGSPEAAETANIFASKVPLSQPKF